MRRLLCRRCSLPIFWRKQRGMNLCRGCRRMIPAIIGDLFTKEAGVNRDA